MMELCVKLENRSMKTEMKIKNCTMPTFNFHLREEEKNNLPDDIVKKIIRNRQDGTRKSLRDLHR